MNEKKFIKNIVGYLFLSDISYVTCVYKNSERLEFLIERTLT